MDGAICLTKGIVLVLGRTGQQTPNLRPPNQFYLGHRQASRLTPFPGSQDLLPGTARKPRLGTCLPRAQDCLALTIKLQGLENQPIPLFHSVQPGSRHLPRWPPCRLYTAAGPGCGRCAAPQDGGQDGGRPRWRPEQQKWLAFCTRWDPPCQIFIICARDVKFTFSESSRPKPSSYFFIFQIPPSVRPPGGERGEKEPPGETLPRAAARPQGDQTEPEREQGRGPSRCRKPRVRIPLGREAGDRQSRASRV